MMRVSSRRLVEAKARSASSEGGGGGGEAGADGEGDGDGEGGRDSGALPQGEQAMAGIERSAEVPLREERGRVHDVRRCERTLPQAIEKAAHLGHRGVERPGRRIDANDERRGVGPSHDPSVPGPREPATERVGEQPVVAVERGRDPLCGNAGGSVSGREREG